MIEEDKVNEMLPYSKLFTGKYKEIHWMMYIIAAAFAINFILR